MLQILSRKQLVQLLTKYNQLNFLKPTLHSVPLTDGSVATVPIFDGKALLIAFLNDPLRMHQENFASNYDIFTGKAKSTIATCPAMILGFVRYNITLGIPTPQFTGEEELSLNIIQENMTVDNNLYMVVHTASDYVSSEQLEKEFVSSFILGDVMNCVYIFKVEAIHGPLFVFKNYGSYGDNATKLFCTLPQRRWGQYFSNKIQS